MQPHLLARGVGRFDVKVDGHLVFSKSQTDRFPNEERLVEELLTTYGNKEMVGTI